MAREVLTFAPRWGLAWALDYLRAALLADYEREKTAMAKKKRQPGVVGLDLSLRSTGACWLPRGWTGDTRQARVMAPCGRDSTGTERDKAMRRNEIASRVLAFVAQHASPGETVYVEEYAFSKKQASATGLHELGGVVKEVLLVELNVEVIPFVASEARRVLLSTKLPRADVKEYVVDQVRRQLKGEAVYWNEDQIDAMVVANAGLAHRGWTPISFPGV
jgi:Holliday junction resolvasome RuvABC endonuclease subunit